MGPSGVKFMEKWSTIRAETALWPLSPQARSKKRAGTFPFPSAASGLGGRRYFRVSGGSKMHHFQSGDSTHLISPRFIRG